MEEVKRSDRDEVWHLIHTHSGKEKQVVAHLQRQGFTSFLPLQAKRIKVGRASKEISVALFPAYVFVCFDPATQNWRPINGTFGVKYLVCFNQIPARVPRGIMEALFARADQGELPAPATTLHPGDLVRIAEGPFAGQIATIETLPSRERARLLLQIMSQWTPIEINQASLELA